MKNILLVAMLASATYAQAGQTTPQTTPTQDAPETETSVVKRDRPMTKAEVKRRRKLRKQQGPEVYKGSVAEQTRMLTDAPGAEKEDGDDSPRKARKPKRK